LQTFQAAETLLVTHTLLVKMVVIFIFGMATVGMTVVRLLDLLEQQDLLDQLDQLDQQVQLVLWARGHHQVQHHRLAQIQMMHGLIQIQAVFLFFMMDTGLKLEQLH
jgi:hypothetical protein